MTGMGTLPYMSPERFINYSPHMTSDIFGLGMIFLSFYLVISPTNFHLKTVGISNNRTGLFLYSRKSVKRQSQ